MPFAIDIFRFLWINVFLIWRAEIGEFNIESWIQDNIVFPTCKMVARWTFLLNGFRHEFTSKYKKKHSTIITFYNYNQFCKLDTFYWIVTPSNSQSTVVVILWFTNVSKDRPEEGRRLKGDVSLEHILDQRLRIRIVRMFGFVVRFTQNVTGFARFDVGSWISKLEWENPALYK